MPIVINATIGSANANSYLTLADMNQIAETMPHMGEWLTDGEINKAQLLVHATRMLDRYFTPFGVRASEVQALLWPREHVIDQRTGGLISQSIIPDFVQMAAAEWAWALHKNPDPYDDVGYGLQRLETPSYRMEFNGEPQRIVPRAVSLLMAPYAYSKSSPFYRVARM